MLTDRSLTHKMRLLEKQSSFVQISGDSPLIYPQIIDNTIKLYENSDCDLVTNILKRSLPKENSLIGNLVTQGIMD